MKLKDFLNVLDKYTYICVETYKDGEYVTLAVNHNSMTNHIDSRSEFYLKIWEWVDCKITKISSHGILTVTIETKD